MTPEKAVEILAKVTSLYPAWFKQDSRAMRFVRASWEDALADDNYEKVDAALKSWVATDQTGKPPTLGWLRNESRRSSKDGMSEGEIIALISKASSNGKYHSKEEFEKLPPICQKIVGSPIMLEKWSQYPSNETETVIFSHIRKDYRNVKMDTEHVSLIPGRTREALGIENQAAEIERLNYEFLQDQAKKNLLT